MLDLDLVCIGWKLWEGIWRTLDWGDEESIVSKIIGDAFDMDTEWDKDIYVDTNEVVENY